MPTRVVRGEILNSRSLARVSIGAELLFRNLIALVDDFGRYEGDPEIIAAHAYPRRREITAKQVEGWLDELANADAMGMGPIWIYEANGRPYLLLVNWERHRGKTRRGLKSRWPDPPLDGAKHPKTASAEVRGDPRGPADLHADPRGSARGVGESGSRGVEEEELTADGAGAPSVISAEWGAVVDAMAAYVPSRARCIETPARRSALRKIASTYGATAPVDAIHGYAALHFTREPRGDFNPETNFTLDTIWRPSKVAKYLDADREAREAGRARPYGRPGGGGLDSTVVNIFEAIKRDRGASLAGL